MLQMMTRLVSVESKSTDKSIGTSLVFAQCESVEICRDMWRYTSEITNLQCELPHHTR